MISIIYFLGVRSAGELSGAKWSTASNSVLGWLGVAVLTITVALTLFSGIGYLAKNWDLMREER
jgi:amino acid transporter